MRASVFDPVGLVVAGGVAVATAGVTALSWLLSRQRRIRLALARQPRVDIRDARDGRVKLVGRARLIGAGLTAPLTGRRCACYDVTVYQLDADGGATKVAAESHGVPFLVDDGTGVAHVDPADAELVLVHDAQRETGLRDRVPEALVEFLRRHRRAARGLLFNRHFKYREGAVLDGEEVVVCGVGRWEPDPDPRNVTGYRQSAMRYRVTGRRGARAIISDDLDLRTLGDPLKDVSNLG